MERIAEAQASAAPAGAVYQKNEEFTGFVEGVGSNGEGSVRFGETVYFAPFTVMGEKVKFRALKVKNRIGYAKAIEILTPADERVRPVCDKFTKCGGCQLQHLRYGSQLKLKSKTVADALRKIAGIDREVPLTVKSDSQFGYRNKLQIPVGVNREGETVIGFYAERSHRIVPVTRCPIHPDWAEDVISVFSEYIRRCGVRGYDEEKRTGQLRHIVVREVEGCFIVTAVTACESLPHAKELIRLLGEKFRFFSLWHNVNGGDGNGVFGARSKLLYGDGRYGGHECGIRYTVGPQTFLQVNRTVCRKLYERAVRFAAESGAECAIDCYSGGGMLTAMLAKQLGRAYGIECVQEAVSCADELAVLNKLDGKMFNRCGTVEKLLPELLSECDPAKTFLLADPPRKGMDRATVKAILASGISAVAMISCNPSTMARDVGLLTGSLVEEGNELRKNPAYTSEGLAGHYKLVSVQPFDMFPQTKHVETLVLLSHKEPDSRISVKVEFGEKEGQISLAETQKQVEDIKPKAKTTYKQIQKYVEENYGFKVHTAYIAEVKRNLGLSMYDAPNAVEELKRPRSHPTEKMVLAIKETLAHFEII